MLVGHTNVAGSAVGAALVEDSIKTYMCGRKRDV